MFPGIYLLLVGVLFLLNNFGYFQGEAWGKLWPLFLIIPALFMIFRPRRTY
ncbi:MAG: LiaI-LiaF-like domain-containing protein [Minisyncoccia bacterium]